MISLESEVNSSISKHFPIIPTPCWSLSSTDSFSLRIQIRMSPLNLGTTATGITLGYGGGVCALSRSMMSKLISSLILSYHFWYQTERGPANQVSRSLATPHNRGLLLHKRALGRKRVDLLVWTNCPLVLYRLLQTHILGHLHNLKYLAIFGSLSLDPCGVRFSFSHFHVNASSGPLFVSSMRVTVVFLCSLLVIL